MGKICLQCGDKGSKNAFVYCIRCLKFVVHRYCLDVIPKTMDEFVHWVCGDDCEGVTQKISVERTIDKIARDVPMEYHDACTKSDPDKSNDNLPVLLLEGEENILPLGVEMEKGNISGRKRLLLNDAPENTKKRKITTIIQPSTIDDEQSLQKEEGNLSGRNSEEGVIKVCHDSKPLSEVDDGQKLISIRSSKKKMTKRKKKILTSSKEINGVCEVNHSSIQEQFGNNGEESNVNNRDTCTDFPNDLHVPSPYPVAMPIWRGSFDIKDGKCMVLDGLLAHVSILACQKVFEEASLLEPVLHLEMLPKSDVWPKSFETLPPRGDNIALYFFPLKNSERDIDRLIEEMKHNELAMRAITQNAELLVFDSTELPLRYWKFHGKSYLWGVFKQKQSTPLNSHLC